MRKIIYYVATSADGFIARTDEDIAWLHRARTAGDYGMAAFYKSIDTVLVGRKTYDVGLKFGQDSYAGKKNFVFSRTPPVTQSPKMEYVAADIPSFANRLRKQKGKHIWLAGGANLAASFLDCDQLDELVLHVIPILIGEGIPLIQARHRSTPLKVLSSRTFSDGVVRIHYSVLRVKTKS
jgi:dihydrofolate reductase